MVIAYLFVTIAIGLWAARRVKNTADFAIAGRHLPMYMIITTTFATWFGSEIVLGVPAKFIEGGLRGVVEDPFGAGMCLILVDRKSTRLNSSHLVISYAVFCLKKKKNQTSHVITNYNNQQLRTALLD